MKRLTNVMIFPNGNLVAFDEGGQQMPELQDSWVNFKALRKLAQRIVKDGAVVEGQIPLGYDPLQDYIDFYRRTLAAPTTDNLMKGEGE